jgi:hypothetical protein
MTSKDNALGLGDFAGVLHQILHVAAIDLVIESADLLDADALFEDVVAPNKPNNSRLLVHQSRTTVVRPTSPCRGYR